MQRLHQGSRRHTLRRPMGAWLDLPFRGYEKSSEALERLALSEEAHRVLGRVSWIVTEKIHGANFSFTTDGASVRCAKRKAFLETDEDFFGHRAVLRRLEAPLLGLFDATRALVPTVGRLTLFGELFGGSYPHSDVDNDASVRAVQTGVYYSPRIEFCAFDLAVEYGALTAPERTWIAQHEARELCERSGVLFVRPLFEGALPDALAYPLGFDSHVPAWLGLPALPRGTNAAEGIVCKPARALRVPSTGALVRPVLKRKLASFAEDKRFHEAEAWSAPDERDGNAWLRQLVSSACTEQRVRSAESKVGRVRLGDRRAEAALIEETASDVLASLREEFGAALRALDDEALRGIEAFARSEAAALVELYAERA